MLECPFIAGSKIEKTHLFIGRKDKLDLMTSLMAEAKQPTSVNVHGERRIGKSSLLYHFYLTWKQRVSPEQSKKFVVVYVSLESAACQQESGFYQQVATALCAEPMVKDNPVLQQAWQVSEWTRTVFSDAVSSWKTQQVLPVLCLDNVEFALKHNQQFDEGFYMNLRSLMSNNSLMLIIASFEPLISPIYKEKYGLTSLFFNQGQTLKVEDFNDAEVTELLKLGENTGMDAKQQKLIRQWGKHNPFHLQLAGVLLCQGKGEVWAKHQFDEQVNSVKLPPPPSEPLLKRIGQTILLPFYGLGYFVKWSGHVYHGLHILIFGLLLSLGIVALLLGKDNIVHFLLEPLIHLWHLLTELLENLWK